jgi:hypothetical protein
MGRPSRSWVRKTYTVSPQVEKAIALRAAEQGIDPGTVMDVLVWNALLKPDDAGLQKGGFTDEELERIFAEEAITHLVSENAIRDLANFIPVDGALGSLLKEAIHLRFVSKLVGRWRKTRLIEKHYWRPVLSSLMGRGLAPRIVEHGLVPVDYLPSALPAQGSAFERQLELERMFANEVLPFLERESVVHALAEGLTLIEEDEISNIRAVTEMVIRWREVGVIEKEYQRNLVDFFGSNWVPRIIKDGLVDEEWFLPD